MKKYYRLTVKQIGEAIMDVPAESEAHAREIARALIDNGTAQIKLDGYGWDSEEITSCEEITKDDVESEADNSEFVPDLQSEVGGSQED